MPGADVLGNPQAGPQDISLVIRKEIVEIEERREPKDSTIFSGIMATNLTEARKIIATPSEYVLTWNSASNTTCLN